MTKRRMLFWFALVPITIGVWATLAASRPPEETKRHTVCGFGGWCLQAPWNTADAMNINRD